VIGYRLELRESVKRGGAFRRDIAPLIPNWRRSIRDPGGDWIGTGDYQGTEDDSFDFFLTGLTNEIREGALGEETWRGFISEMELTVGKVSWRRSIFDMANAVRSIYSSIGDNMLTNGGGESGPWTAYGGATVTQSTTWRTQGTYSIRIQAGAGAQGAYIQQNLSITATTPYDLRVSVKIVSGTWMLAVIRTDTSEALAEVQEATVGEVVMTCSVSDTSDYAGTVHIRLETIGGAGEIYADAAVFQRGPIRAETGWYENALSQAEFGRIENILLRAGMSVSAANDEVQTYLNEHAWPRSLPQDQFEVDFFHDVRQAIEAPQLSLTCVGYWATLNFRYCRTSGTDDASDHVASLIGQSEFVTAGVVQANTRLFQIEDQAPLKAGDTLAEIAAVGDDSGNHWYVGVSGDHLLDYLLVPRTPKYRYRNGMLYDIAGGQVDPWFVRPGWIYLDDMPVGPGYGSGDAADDPRWVYAAEIEFQAPDKIQFRRAVVE